MKRLVFVKTTMFRPFLFWIVIFNFPAGFCTNINDVLPTGLEKRLYKVFFVFNGSWSKL